MQLILYTLAVENMYGKRPKLAGWWFLRKNKKVMVEINQEKIDKVKVMIEQIVASIRNADFHPEPGWVCKNCDFKLICNEAKL